MAAKKPFFSIIIPALNEEKYLPKLLDCIKKQKNRDFEVLLVDGGSKDSTVDIAETFQRVTKDLLAVTVIKSKLRNVSLQRNLGAERARGDYLIFFDADTQIAPVYLTKIYSHIAINHSPFLTTWMEADSDNSQDKLIAFFGNLALETTQFMEISFVPGFNIIVQKKAFNHVGGFNGKVVLAEDHDIAKRLHNAGYDLLILKEPKVVFSLRRFRAEGRLSVLRKYAKASAHILFKGPITKEIFEYEMGGHIYKREREDGFRAKRRLRKKMKEWRNRLDKYLQKIELLIDGKEQEHT